MDSACHLVTLHLDPEHPMELSQVGNFNMLAEASLEVIHKAWLTSSNCAVINMNCHYDYPT